MNDEQIAILWSIAHDLEGRSKFYKDKDTRGGDISARRFMRQSKLVKEAIGMLANMPSDTCEECGCTEFLCGHNKRG